MGLAWDLRYQFLWLTRSTLTRIYICIGPLIVWNPLNGVSHPIMTGESTYLCIWYSYWAHVSQAQYKKPRTKKLPEVRKREAYYSERAQIWSISWRHPPADHECRQPRSRPATKGVGSSQESANRPSRSFESRTASTVSRSSAYKWRVKPTIR